MNIEFIFAVRDQLPGYRNTFELVITDTDIEQEKNPGYKEWLKEHKAYTCGHPGAVVLVRETGPGGWYGSFPHSDLKITVSDIVNPGQLKQKMHTAHLTHT